MILRKLDTATGKPIRVAVPANGWRIRLNVAAEPGERADRRAIPDYSPNVTALYSMIPLGDDPCDPGRRFGVMFLDAATGGALSATGTGNVGAVLRNSTPIPDPVVREGGGEIMIPGLPPSISGTINDAINAAYTPAPWHRGAWKELLDLQ